MSVYSPWIDKQADNIRATVDVLAVIQTKLVIQLFTKSEHAAGSGIEVDSTRTITTSTVERRLQEWGSATDNGLRGLIRFQFTASVTLSSGVSNYIMFRMLKSVWFDTVGFDPGTLPNPSGEPT
jgi:hypothetical protein